MLCGKSLAVFFHIDFQTCAVCLLRGNGLLLLIRKDTVLQISTQRFAPVGSVQVRGKQGNTPCSAFSCRLHQRHIDAQCGIADKLKASGDVKAAMDAYIAAKTIPDWLDGSIGGEAPFIRAMLGEAECMRELSPNDTSPADKIVAHIAETSPDILQRARLLIKLGRKDEAVLLLGKKLDEWKTEMKKRDSGYYSAQPAYLSYLEPSAADRKRRFGPLIKEAEKIMEEIGQSR